MVGAEACARWKARLLPGVSAGCWTLLQQHARRSSGARMSAGQVDGHPGHARSCSVLSFLRRFAGIWWAMST